MIARQSSSKTLKILTAQIQDWTIVGPIPSPPGVDKWTAMELDAAKTIPADVRSVGGYPVVTRKVTMEGSLLDFGKHLGNLGEGSQAFAFTEIEVPEDGGLTLAYDADWWTIVWIDGKEVYATRDGNGGDIGPMKHFFEVGLKQGKHTVVIRIISGKASWTLLMRLMGWRQRVGGMLRADRGARWRDYTRTMVRHENRPEPNGMCGGVSKEQFELLMLNLGVDARWIAVVQDLGGSYYKSDYLPMHSGAKPEHEKQLKEWVELLHKHRMSVMTWYALSFNEAACEKHPEWRQQYLVGPAPNVSSTEAIDRACCINTLYGDALIGYVIEFLQKFDLDGVWFDGSSFTPIWNTPQPISCVCPCCRKKFKKDTGLDLPAKYDWSNPGFRRWVQWRYDMFSQYWQRLVDTVHASVPEATIVFNHYHREHVGWNGAIPLNPFGRNFVSGTEADGDPLKGAFHTRCMRAYGRPDTEVWLGLSGAVRRETVRGSMNNPRRALNFAIACSTAGGHASVGGAENSVEAPVLGRIADELKPRAPYLNLPSVPFAALHISQQSETFVFGRNPRFITEGWTDYYWNSLTGWHHLLAYAGLSCDVIYDDHLTANGISKYPVLVMPLALALTRKQFNVIMNYAKKGGTLLTGPWFGVCDEMGEPRKDALGERTTFPFGQTVPSWEEIENMPELALQAPEGRKKHREFIKAKPLSCLPAGRYLLPASLTGKNPIIKHTRIGKGQIIQTALDPGTLFRQSNARDVVESIRCLFGEIARPLVEVIGEEGLILGIFKQGPNTTVAHIQQYPPPWDTEDALLERPKTRWNAVLVWRGAKPKAVQCALPELGPALTVTRRGQFWQVVLPPFVWGQIVIIEE